MSPRAYVNECAGCDQIEVMHQREDVPASIWLHYCPACIDLYGHRFGIED